MILIKVIKTVTINNSNIKKKREKSTEEEEGKHSNNITINSLLLTLSNL